MRRIALVALAAGLWAGAALAQQTLAQTNLSQQDVARPNPLQPPSVQQDEQRAPGWSAGAVAEGLPFGGAADEGSQVKAEAHAPGVAPRRAVLELFTSQGCSSCPAADALLKRLADRGDAITLSLPVDYWDYLGWKDTLASPKFTERQRAYARTRGDGAIYTPQVVVNGVAHVNGGDETQIRRAIDRTERALPLVAVELRREPDKLVIETGGLSRAAPGKEATIWLLAIAKSVAVPIERGENQGRTVTYYNVVRELIPVGTWNGRPVKVELTRESLRGVERCAVLLQQGATGPIIGSALLQEF